MSSRIGGVTVSAGTVAVLIVAIIAGGASAVGPPQTLRYACALKSNGLLRAVSSPSDCISKKETLVTFSVAAPVVICIQPDGSVRQVPQRDCTKASGTSVTVPSNTPRYFCADTTKGGVLRHVSDPATCRSTEIAYVVVNHAPTDIALGNASVAENQPAGTTVGTLTATDPDPGDSRTFTLVAGFGDNASFTIAGTTLKTAQPFDFETKSSYSLRIRATDLLGLTYEENFTITVTDVAENPIVTTSAGATAYTENAAAVAVDGALTVSDPDSVNLAGAVVRISAGFQAGDALTFTDQLGISATSYNAATGVLTLSGSSSVANYRTALRSVGFRETGDNPSASRTVEFKVNDGAFDSAPATKAIAITPVNDAPVVTTSGGALSFTEGDPAMPIDSAVAVTDADSTIATATAQITSNFSSAQDVLAMPVTAGIGSSYDSATGTLTLTGPASPAAFQAALRTVTYRNTSSNPSPPTRTVTLIASDGALS